MTTSGLCVYLVVRVAIKGWRMLEQKWGVLVPTYSHWRANAATESHRPFHLDALLRRDPLRLRRLLPRRVRQRMYDRRLTRERAAEDPRAAAITTADFTLREQGLEQALDVIAVCRALGSPAP